MQASFHRRHDFGSFGIRGADGLGIDIPAVLARLRALRDGFVKGPEAVPDEMGKRAMAGHARLVAPDTVAVDGQRITARTFREDPRFGIIVLTEIASRALSPAVNDPGTAIDVIGRHLRILSLWRDPVAADPDYPDVLVPRITAQDLIEDARRPIPRHGAGLVEVQIRLQKILPALQNAAPAAFEAPVKTMRRYALAHAKAAPMAEHDLTALQDVMQQERA